ncbi:translocation and assembly module TamB [Bathymodiolus japonicus methanotrophic gill symbiont]|uniref:translocation/assembly module TamB domain-containing protein n=1 Tax=Bathymodiolus japonicus methanotrophic gill symbiont TaxID=113269 RepID=UPI001B64A23A|nr:translocation/assembly module TamB domain-containing protein [Bathymodiolus japonicus methanotrophic gill symbiont]GFO72039.1 translocation and assembly module TamB [Bathymodiolus japonicus methanotrophic gill symbiont]
MKPLLHNGLLILSAAGLAVVLLLIILVSNRPFNSWLLMQLIEQVPGLSIERVDGLVLDELRLSGVSYQADEVTVHARGISYQFKWLDLLATRIRFKTFQASDVNIEIHALDAQDSESGSMDFIMPLALQIDDFSLQKLSIQQQNSSYLIDQLSLALNYQGKQIKLSQFSLHSDMGKLDGKAELQLTAQFPFKAEIAVARIFPEIADVKAQVSLYGDSQKIYLNAQLLAPNKAQAEGWIDLSAVPPQFDLQLSWAALQWPLQGEKQYASENARLTVQGSVEQYYVTLNSSMSAQDLASGQLFIEGQGDAEQFTFDTLTLKSPNGEVHSKGRISWVADISSEIQLRGNKIQLGSLQPDYPAELSLDAQLSGQLFNRPDFQIKIDNVFGNLMDKELQGKAAIHYSAEQARIEHLEISVGDNFVDIHGQMGADNSLAFNLEANNLHQLDADLAGSIFAQGTLRGSIEQPLVKFKIKSTGLSFQDQQIGSLQSSGILDVAGKGQLELQLIAQEMIFNGQKVDQVKLQSTGQSSQHELRAELHKETLRLELAMQGAWMPLAKQWQGEIRNMQVQSESAGVWQIIRASPIEVVQDDQQSLQLATDFCLAQKNSTGLFCINVQSESAGHALAGTIKQLPLAVFADWIPSTIKVNSLLHSEFFLSLEENVQGNVQLTLDPGVMVVQDEELGVQRLDFKGAHVDAWLLADSMQSNLSLLINDANYVKGQVGIHGLQRPESAQINSLLNVHLEQIGFISAFADSVSHVAGNINGELHIQGLLQSPDLNNSWLKLQQGSLTVVDAGLTVSDISLELTHAQTGQVFVRGEARIKGQSLLLNGQVDDYSNDKMQFKLAIKGEDLPLLQLPEMQAWLSPNLQISGNKHGANVQGDIRVPKAMMVFQTLPEGAVQISPDEVIISDAQVQVKPSGYPVDTDVLIKLGDEVAIEGFGLKARLEGSLRALQKKNHLKLFNELNFREGTYVAYGQDLKIDKGQFLFVGDIENPGISILASRKATDWDDKTVAYLSLTGTLKKPVTRIYTEPALNDSEALAYLLTGAPLGNGDSSSAGLIAKAALSLGRDYVDAVMGTVGVDEFDIKSSNLGQNSMIVGKRITPRLYARYIMDILTTQMQFAVEYKLTENISIETRAGSTHSSDIKYNIEFD